MILEVGMTMYLYVVSCAGKLDLIASDLDLLKSYTLAQSSKRSP